MSGWMVIGQVVLQTELNEGSALTRLNEITW